VPISSNIRNVVLTACSWMYGRTQAVDASIDVDGVPDTLLSSLDVNTLNGTGTRSQIGRVLRIIYATLAQENLCQIPVENEWKNYAATNSEFAPAHKKSGQFVTDNHDEITGSVLAALYECCVMAFDAAAQDQHEGTGDRSVLLEQVRKRIPRGKNVQKSEFAEEYGISFWEYFEA